MMISSKNYKSLLYIGVVLVLVASASASNPSWQLSLSTNNTIVNGNNSVGDLVVTRTGWTPTIVSLVNLSDYSVEQHDALQWLGNFSVVVRSPAGVTDVVTPGNTYSFVESGGYSWWRNGDATNTYDIVSATASVDSLVFAYSGADAGVELLFDPQKFFNAAEVLLPLKAVASSTAETGAYSFLLSATTKNVTKTIRLNVTLAENKEWVVLENLSNYSVRAKAGEVLPLGEIVVRNEGNTEFVVSATIAGNASLFLETQDSQTLYPRTKSVFNVLLSVPQKQKDGLYRATIYLNGGDNNYSQEVNVVVTDKIPPVIESHSFFADELWVENSLFATITDNVEVSRANLSLGNRTFNLSKDANVWSTTLNFTEPRTYDFLLCAVDDADNVECEPFSKSFNKYSRVVVPSTSVKLPAKKVGKVSSEKFFSLSEDSPFPIRVSLHDFVVEMDNKSIANYVFELREDATGEHITLDASNNWSVSVQKKSDYFLRVKSDLLTEYSGRLRFSLPAGALAVADITFTGKHLDYDLPEGFTRDWYYGNNLTCTVGDTGDLDTSYSRCCVNYPITSPLDQLTIPISLKEKALMEETLNTTISDWDDKVSTRNIFINALLGLLLCALLVVVYAVRIHPYYRFRRD